MEQQGKPVDKPRGRNAYNKNDAKRALTIARETPGVDHVVIETPAGAKYIFHLDKKPESKEGDCKRGSV
jgi:hypothetical protein